MTEETTAPAPTPEEPTKPARKRAKRKPMPKKPTTSKNDNDNEYYGLRLHKRTMEALRRLAGKLQAKSGERVTQTVAIEYAVEVAAKSLK